MNELQTKELQGLQQVQAQSNVFAVQSAAEYTQGAELLKDVKARRSFIVEFFQDSKAKAHATWKSICNKEKEFTDILDTAEAKIKIAMLKWKQAEDRRAAEERMALQREADLRARQEQERLDTERFEAMQSGDVEEVVQLQSQTVAPAPIVSVQPSTPKVAGLQGRSTWKARVIDKAEFIGAVVKNFELMQQYLIVDQSALNAFARTSKGQTKIAGVEFFEEESLASGH